MIAYLKGTYLYNTMPKIVIGIQSHNVEHTIGYEVAVPQTEAYLRLYPQQTIELFIYHHIKQDSMELYGFLTQAEKNLFTSLLEANGIGPKSALNVLSNASVNEVIDAIMHQDSKALSKIPGIGKKTAERLVLDLKDNINKRNSQGLYGTLIPKEASSSNITQLKQQAALVLHDLGFNDHKITQALESVISLEKNCLDLQELVRSSLRYLSINH